MKETDFYLVRMVEIIKKIHMITAVLLKPSLLVAVQIKLKLIKKGRDDTLKIAGVYISLHSSSLPSPTFSLTSSKDLNFSRWSKIVQSISSETSNYFLLIVAIMSLSLILASCPLSPVTLGTIWHYNANNRENSNFFVEFSSAYSA